MKLPKFLYNLVSKHRTSLGDNQAFPPEEDYPFDYKILNLRFKEVVENIKNNKEITSLDPKYLLNLLSSLIKECKIKEEKIKGNLVKVCQNIVSECLKIPKDTLILNCELVNSLSPKHPFRIMPEESENRDFDFEDLNDFNNASKVILKRRLINSLIQGASYRCTQLSLKHCKEINDLDSELIPLYKKIILINDYLLFTKKEKINDKKTMQGSYVEVMLGRHNEKTEINSQGIIFPLLLNDTFRGMFELFASHGLPTDYVKANYIIKQADFLLAEPWDLRMGVKLWDLLCDGIEDTNILPYYFTLICKMDVNEFNDNLKEIFAHTKLGNKIKYELINKSKKISKMNDFLGTIDKKNANSSILNDSYLSSDDLDNYILDNNNSGIIEEDLNKKDLIECSVDDITFNDYLKSDISAQMQVILKGVKIPINLIDFEVQVFTLFDGSTTYQGDIKIDESLQGHNLAYKILLKFILENEQLYFSKYLDRNHEQMNSIKIKLSKTLGIGYEIITNYDGEHEGVLFYKK